MNDNENRKTITDVDSFIFRHLKAGAFPWSSVPHLRAISKVFGLDVANTGSVVLDFMPDSCVNSLLFARNNPKSEIYVFTPSKAKYDWLVNLVKEEKLENIKFSNSDLDSFVGKLQFDYIIAEKALSNGTEEQRKQLWSLAHNNLAKNGVLLAEYDTVPGASITQAARDIVSYHVQGAPNPEERYRQAVALLKFIGEDSDMKHSIWYKEVLNNAAKEFKDHADDAGRIYEKYLLPAQAFRFDQVVSEAMSHGLQFVAEADFASMYLANLPKGAQEQLKKLDNIVTAEQYKDLVTCRSKRRSIFCKMGIKMTREISTESITDLSILNLMHCEDPSKLKVCTKDSETAVKFRVGNSEVPVNNYLLLNTLYVLETKWQHSPAKVSELVEEVVKLNPNASLGEGDTVKNVIMQMVLRGAAFLYDGEIISEQDASFDEEKPYFSSLVRACVMQGDLLPNIYYHNTRIDELSRFVISKADGKTSLDQIVEEAIKQGKLQVKDGSGKAIEDANVIKQAVREGASRAIAGLRKSLVK